MDVIQVGIAIRAVDDGLEPGGQHDRLVGDVEAEVRRSRFTLHRNAFELATELACGLEDAGDPLDGGEIGVCEGVAPCERRGSGILLAPGPELALRLNRALRQRVGELRGERHPLSNTELAHLERVDREQLRLLASGSRNDPQLGAIGLEPVDDERRPRRIRGWNRRSGSGRAIDLHPARRDADAQLVQGDGSETPGPVQQPDDAAFHRKAADRNERRHVTASLVADHQPLAADGDRRENVDAERAEFDFAVQAIGEGLDDESAQLLGPRPGGGGDRQSHERSDDSDENPPRSLERHNGLTKSQSPQRRGTTAAKLISQNSSP